MYLVSFKFNSQDSIFRPKILPTIIVPSFTRMSNWSYLCIWHCVFIIKHIRGCGICSVAHTYLHMLINNIMRIDGYFLCTSLSFSGKIDVIMCTKRNFLCYDLSLYWSSTTTIQRWIWPCAFDRITIFQWWLSEQSRRLSDMKCTVMIWRSWDWTPVGSN